MRASVAARGFEASTFDQVARAAGVCPGQLHYKIGKKERRNFEAGAHDRLDRALVGANTVDDVLAALVQTFEDILGEGPGQEVMFFEVLTLAQRNQEIAAQLADVGKRMRMYLADALRERAEAGALTLRTDAETAAGFLLTLADGLTIRILSEPEFDIGPLMTQSVAAARALLG